MDALQELVESDPGYTERVTGYPPGQADAQSLLMMRPDGLPAVQKQVLGLWDGEQLVPWLICFGDIPTSTRLSSVCSKSTGDIADAMRARRVPGSMARLYEKALC